MQAKDVRAAGSGRTACPPVNSAPGGPGTAGRVQRSPAGGGSVGSLLALQRSAGNRAVTTLVVQREGASRDEQLAKLREKVGAGEWREVATRLNGFDDADVGRIAAGLSEDAVTATWAAVAQYLAGWPRERALLGALVAGRDPRLFETVASAYGRREGAGYGDVKDNPAYVDNFTSASYNMFRHEIQLDFDDGKRIAIPLGYIERPAPAAVSPALQQRIARLQLSGDLTLPTSDSTAGNGLTTITVRGPDEFYDDPATGLIRPRTMHAGVVPRIHRAVAELDPDTQNLLFKAATAFMAGPPVPEGAEYLVLLPIFARGGVALHQVLVRAAERRALTAAEQAELGRLLVRSGTGQPSAAGPEPRTGSLRPPQPGDYPLPLPGETAEMYARRTATGNESWEALPEPARKLRIESAKRTMEQARLQNALRDPGAVFQHYLTSDGFEEIMLSQQLRSGGGQAGYGHGAGIRAMPGPFSTATPLKSIHLDFTVPNPPVPGAVEPFHYMGDGVMWRLPEGDMLPIVVQRVGYPNGAIAERGGSKGWLLRGPGAKEPRELTLQQLIQAGRSPE